MNSNNLSRLSRRLMAAAIGLGIWMAATMATAAGVAVDGTLIQGSGTSLCKYSSIKLLASGDWQVVCDASKSKTITFTPNACSSGCGSFSTVQQLANGDWTVANCLPGTVALVTPDPNQSIVVMPAGTTLALAATAGACSGAINQVEFFANSAAIAGSVDFVPPYQATWTPAAGHYLVQAKATHTAGAVINVVASQTANLYVNQPPAVTFSLSPSGPRSAPATLQLAATASDSDGIKHVEFRLSPGGGLLATSETAPYQFTWANILAGNYQVYARAVDTFNTSADSDIVAVTIKDAASNLPPSVTVTQPAQSQSLHAPVTLQASASDSDGNVVSVQYFDADATPPTEIAAATGALPNYPVVWNASPGVHRVFARAIDNSGAVGESAVRVFTIINDPPSIQLSGFAGGNYTGFVGSPIELRVDAADPDGSSVNVRFRNPENSNDWMIANGNPAIGYSAMWTPTQEGVFQVRAEASDAFGAVTVASLTVSVQVRPSVTPYGPSGTPSNVGATTGTFAVAENGAATYSIPIAIPPAPAGSQPSIAINYNSQGGTGPLGFGWSVGATSSITRCGATVAHNGVRNGINYDGDEANDYFCLDGQRLIPVSVRTFTGNAPCQGGTADTYLTEYRTEIESYSRIVAYEEDRCSVAGPSRFEVLTKSGQWLLFGVGKSLDYPNGFFGDGDNGTWVLSWPSTLNMGRPNSVKVWPLVRSMDRAGNLIRYRYCGTNLQGNTGPCQIYSVQPNVQPDPFPGSFPPTEHHLKTIYYGGRADPFTRIVTRAPTAYVDFTYTPRPSDLQRVFDSGGGETTLSYSLKSITSYVERPVLNTTEWVASQSYFFTYSAAATTQRLRLDSLKQCTRGVGSSGNEEPSSVCLNPTTFTYQLGTGANLAMVVTPIDGDQRDANSAGDVDGDGRTDLIYLKDGESKVKVARAATAFGWVERNLVDVATNQPLIVRRGAERYLADFNGDGRADLILVNGGKYVLCDLQFASGSNATCKRTLINAAAQDFYLQGDFNGDGKIDVLLLRLNESGASKWDMHYGDAGSGFTSTPIVATLPRADNMVASLLATQFAAGDFNGDGRTDVIYRQQFAGGCQEENMCHPGVVKWTVCFSRPFGPPFVCGNPVDGPSRALDVSATLDFNGDGIADLAHPSWDVSTTDWNVCLSSGEGSFARPDEPLPVRTGATGPQYTFKSLCKVMPIVKGNIRDVIFGDFDGDGKTDIARHKENGTWTFCYARTGSLGTANHVEFACVEREVGFSPNGSAVDNVFTGDFDGDGKTDLFSHNNVAFKLARTPTGTPDLLSGVQNGLGATTAISYAPLTNAAVYSVTGATAGTDEIVVTSPLYVVSATQESTGTGETFNKAYAYAGLKGSTNGRGLLGFASRTVTELTVTDLAPPLQQVTEYNQSLAEWWLAGRAKRATTKAGSVVLSEAVNTWGRGPAVSEQFTNIIYPVHLLKTIEKKADLDGSALSCTRMTLYDGDPPAGTPTLPAQVDQYGNVLVTVTETASTCNPVTGAFGTDGNKKKTTNTFLTSPGNWVLGRLATASVTHSEFGVPTAITRRSRFTYHGLGASCGSNAPLAHLCSEIVEPDDTGTMKHTTSYAYDEWGNVTSTSVSFRAQEPVTRTSTVEFDVSGRHPIRLTDPRGQFEERTYDLRTGAVLSVTKTLENYLDDVFSYLVTLNAIDDFGRKVATHTSSHNKLYSPERLELLAASDSTWENVAPNAIPGVPEAKYSVRARTRTGSESTVYFDSLQREVYRVSKGFSVNETPYVRTTYDIRGRKSTVTRPSGPGAVTVRYEYDALDRVSKETTTSSGSSVISLETLTTYKGRDTVVRSVGSGVTQKAITRRNIQGQIVSVKECLGIGVATQSTAINCEDGTTAVETQYAYDAAGNTVSVSSPGGAAARTATYDTRGRKIASTDPDLGNAQYAYSGANELIEQRYKQDSSTGPDTVTTYRYDEIGRIISKAVGNYMASYGYDQCGHGFAMGELCYSNAWDGTHITEKFFYFDEYGRPYRTSMGVGTDLNGPTEFAHTYDLKDALSRPSQTVYPTLEGVKYTYTAYAGDLQSVKDLRAPSIIHWQANSRFSDGQINSMVVGANTVSKTYDGFGRVDTITSPGNQSGDYGFDAFGNLTSRVDLANGLAAESFTYDTLNRVSGGTGVNIAYDVAGNISSKNNVGYGYSGSNRVLTVGGSPYVYDNVGNLKSGGGRSITWKAFNMPASATKGTQNLSWSYGPDFERVREVSSSTGTTIYFPGGERIQDSAGNLRYRHYVKTPEGVIATLDVDSATGAVQRRYLLRDHLGSTVATIDSGVKTPFGYDAWGARLGTPPSVNAAQMQRGYTGHEMLDEVGLVHMNGRIYDPLLGKFLSADPIVQSPFNGQSWNRYSYVMNNPLSATDPTGYASFWAQWRRPIAAIAVAVAAPYALSAVMTYSTTSCIAMTANMQTFAAMAGGFAAGGIAGGNIQSALQGAILGGLNFGVGEAFEVGPGAALGTHVGNVAGHAAIGCLQHASAGGSCLGGVLSGGFSAAAGSVPGLSDTGLLGRVAVGAIASRLAGDKAQTGAITAAFDYLFNYCNHESGCTSFGEQFAYDYAPGYKAGTLISNQTIGDGSWSAWEVVDGLSLGLGFAGKGLSAGLSGGANSVFWSGGPAAMERAASLGISLERTPVGGALSWIQEATNTRLPRWLWREASKTFATNATGTAQVVVLKQLPNSIFNTVELPILQLNGVIRQYR